MYNNKNMGAEAPLHQDNIPFIHRQSPSLPRARMPVNPATLIQIGILSEKDLGEAD